MRQAPLPPIGCGVADEMEVLLIVGAALVATGVIAAIIGRRIVLALGLQIAGAAILGAGGIWVLAADASVGSEFRSDVTPAFGFDGLSAFFAVVVCLTAVPALVTVFDDLRETPTARPLVALTGVFLLALVGVLAARDVMMFLAFWELMTLVPAAAILLARRDREVRRDVFVYLGVTHLGGAGVWIALLTLAYHYALGGPSLQSSGTVALVTVAALVGFGTKAGLMPLHSWLPRAHPVAPSHISALMSAVMIKVALYGLVRVLFEWVSPPLWAGIALVALGALSAVGGIFYATVQHELKRLLAFSSIENVGIVALGLGASLILDGNGETAWSAIAFGAALLHIANHAAFKALLFLAAGAFYRAVGELQLDQLGGLLRRMPWTGWSFLVGCAAIAPLPPLNGFASEWITFQALLHLGYDESAGIAAVGAAAVALLAVTAGLVVFCFVKVIGLVLLGGPRTPRTAAAAERPVATRGAVTALAGVCVVLGLMPGLLLPTLAGLAPGTAEVPTGLRLDLPGTGGFAPLGVVVALVVVCAGLLWLTGRRPRAAATPAWACGQRVEPALAWTSAGFSNPLRVVLRFVYRPDREVRVGTQDGVVTEVAYRAEIPHLFDTLLYEPLNRRALGAAATVRRLQSGSLRTYLVYLLALVIVLLAIVHLGVLQ